MKLEVKDRPADIPSMGLLVYTGFGSGHERLATINAAAYDQNFDIEIAVRRANEAKNKKDALASAEELLNAENPTTTEDEKQRNLVNTVYLQGNAKTHVPPLTVYRQRQEDVHVVQDTEKLGLAGESAFAQSQASGVFLGAKSKDDLPLFRTIKCLLHIAGKFVCFR